MLLFIVIMCFLPDRSQKSSYKLVTVITISFQCLMDSTIAHETVKWALSTKFIEDNHPPYSLDCV